MNLVEKTIDSILVLRPLAGNLDFVAGPELGEILKRRIAAGHQRLVLDLSVVEFIDSSGLSAVVASVSAIGREGRLAVCHLQDRVLAALRLSKVDRMVEIAATVDQAADLLSDSQSDR